MRPLTEDDFANLASAVERITIGSLAVGRAFLSHPPLEGSRANRVWESRAGLADYRGTGSAAQALSGDLFTTMLAAHDHLTAVATLIRAPSRASVALAALTRAAVETLGRVAWLLDGHDVVEPISRMTQLHLDELQWAKKMRERDSRSRPNAEWNLHAFDPHILQIQQFQVDFGLTPDGGRPPDAARLVLGDNYHQGAQIYSGLSAAAHGQVFAIANFLSQPVTNDAVGDGRLQLVPTDTMIIEYALYAVDAVDSIVMRLVKYFAPDEPAQGWMADRTFAVSMADGYDHLR
jgi:hypothetical protein